MADWVRVGTNVGIGAGVGALDQIVQNKDDDRALARSLETPPDKLDLMSQYGTYFNYGVPVLAIAATVMGWLPRGYEDRIMVSASQLAGRRITWRYTKEKKQVGYPNYYVPYMAAGGGYHRNAALEQARQAQLAAARAAAARGGFPQSETEIPVVSGDEILA